MVVRETWSNWEPPAHELALELGTPRVKLFYRTGTGADAGRVATATLGDAEKAFELEPWLQRWVAERRGTWVAATAESWRARPGCACPLSDPPAGVAERGRGAGETQGRTGAPVARRRRAERPFSWHGLASHLARCTATTPWASGTPSSAP
jgi:hypothetical protein